MLMDSYGEVGGETVYGKGMGVKYRGIQGKDTFGFSHISKSKKIYSIFWGSNLFS